MLGIGGRKRKKDKRLRREITIRFQENANRKVVDYKRNVFEKFLIFQKNVRREKEEE